MQGCQSAIVQIMRTRTIGEIVMSKRMARNIPDYCRSIGAGPIVVNLYITLLAVFPLLGNPGPDVKRRRLHNEV